jgi:hypothetical protein
MTTERPTARLLAERRDELARAWLAHHLAALALPEEEGPVVEVHQRAPALLEALERGLRSGKGERFGSFDFREAVQIIALMARALAQADLFPATAGALVPALGRALERAGTADMGALTTPLAASAAESYTTTCLLALEARHQALLARSTPVLLLSDDLLLVAPVADPDQATAAAIVDRVSQEILQMKTSTPRVILDLSYLAQPTPEVLGIFRALGPDLQALGGTLQLVGEDTKPLAQTLASSGRKSLLKRLRDALKLKAAGDGP